MDKTICMRCKDAGTKGFVPYKIIKDVDGQSIQFIGQLCTRCYKELFEQSAAQEQKEESNG